MAPKSRSTQSSKAKCNNIAIKPQDKVSPIPVYLILIGFCVRLIFTESRELRAVSAPSVRSSSRCRATSSAPTAAALPSNMTRSVQPSPSSSRGNYAAYR